MKKNIGFAIAFLVLTAGCSFAQYSAPDPTRTIPNARILGLGKAYIGLAEGTGALYTNPAGLAESTGWQLSSMSGKFLDEYSYLSFSGLYATTAGVIGIGYAGTSIAGAWPTTIEAGSDPADPIYTYDYSQPEMGNKNNALIISYANQMKNIMYLNKIPYADRIALGTNLKLFSASLYGDGITGGDASGLDMDLGVKFYPPQKWLTLGATVQNMLPSNLGGKLVYSSGHEESYPAVLELGSATKLVGKENALQTFGQHEVNLMLDLDTYPTMKNYPWVWHAGLEWKPFSMLSMRFGIDQDAIGDGNGGLKTVSDNAFGVGLNFAGFSFDYAYHTFAGSPSIDNHYFSLAYALAAPAAAEIKEPIVVSVPPDRYITFESKVPVIGRVIDPRIRKLTINGLPLKFTLQGDFSTIFELKTGKNAILLNEKKVRVLRLVTFPDVKIGYWVDMPISMLAMSKIITGYPDGSFKPEGNITRAEMCTLLMKTRSQLSSQESTGEASVVTAFKDVASKHWAAKFIANASKLGVVKGYPDGSFKPNGKITRAEGLAMIARFAGISEETYARQFRDVNDSLWAAKIIAGAYKAGILKYLEMKPFEPNRQLTRSETVEMLYRTETVKAILRKGLIDWESY
jgi:hypothetical protein